MQRLTRIAFALALPATIAGCPSPDDNEENVDETGADTDSSPTDPSGNPTTDPSGDPTTDPSGDPTTDPSETETDPDTSASDPTTESETDPPPGCVSADDPDAPRMEVTAPVETDTTLTCDTVWVLTGETFVNGAVLTIEAGTSVVGQNGGALVINTDAQLVAAGSEDAPIVFTSAQPVGERARADWGGLVLLGNAEVNLPNGVGLAEGFADPPMYGGTDAAHNCGTLQYVRVEWAGFELVTDNELNGIGFFACGTDTVVDHVQSHMGSDDAFEAFGGGFDMRYVVASGMGDDAFDFDLGFTGTVQYALVHQDPSEADGNHALEWSNGPDDFTATPLTSPWIANMTFVGQGAGGNAGKSIGFNVKQGTEAYIFNSYYTNVTGLGATFQDEATITVAEGGGIVVEGNFWNDHAGFGFQGDGPYTWDEMELETFILDQPGNMDGVDLMLDGTWGAPNVKPAADSAAVGGGVDPGNAALDATTYVGAVDPEAADDWTQAGWINYAD
jgi:hypothetical protein